MIRDWQIFIEGILFGWLIFVAFPSTIKDFIKESSTAATAEQTNRKKDIYLKYNISWREIKDES